MTIRRRVATLLAALALLTALAVPMAAPRFAAGALLWTLTATPLAATTGVSTTFSLTASLLLLGRIECIVVDVPSNFSVAGAAVTGSNAGDSWVASTSGNRVSVLTTSGGDRLEGIGDNVRFAIQATARSAGSLTWAARAYEDDDCVQGPAVLGVPPVVVVTDASVTPTPAPAATPGSTPSATPRPTPTPVLPVPVPSVLPSVGLPPIGVLPTPTPRLPQPGIPTPRPGSSASASSTSPATPRPSIDPGGSGTRPRMPGETASIAPPPLLGASPGASTAPGSVPRDGPSGGAPGSPSAGGDGPGSPGGSPRSRQGQPSGFVVPVSADDGAASASVSVPLLAGELFVPAAVIAGPGLVLLVWVALQAIGASAWLPAARRLRGEEGAAN